MKNKYQNILDNITDKKSPKEHILIIDGLNTFLRCFAIINLRTVNGHHIGGLTGFLKSIGYAIKMFNPTKVIIVFDGVGGSSSKRNLLPSYKSNRYVNRITNYSTFASKEEEKESIGNQIERLMDYLKCLPINTVCIDGLEADDIIGKLVSDYENDPDVKSMTIMSADKDFLQLVSPKTQIYSPSKKKVYKEIEVLEEYKISSKNFLMYKVLLGDKSDNVPGISGLGEKKLLKLYPELGENNEFTLKEVFDKAQKGGNIIYDKIVENNEQLIINSKIMNLKDVPISEGNLDLIDEFLSQKNILDKNQFKTMYNNDLLGNAISNIDDWLYQVFNCLNTF